MIPESNPFKVPSVTEEDYEKGPRAGELKRMVEWVNFYKSDNYAKDETTNRMMARVTKETCKTTDGFVCKVRQACTALHQLWYFSNVANFSST